MAECAYAHWHRMLFARFLAENRLLIHPQLGVPVTLAECEELAAEAGEKDGWALAGRFAARMLPAIFDPTDPILAVRLAPEHQQKLEALLGALPADVFTADDSLGWVYQFWQAKRKDEVNEAAKAGRKIGADELPAVTQLFTEPYMVKFLLHNTLGAWWAGRVLAERPELASTAGSEEELRCACALPGYDWSYLRFVRNGGGGAWRPAAGTFERWPKRAAEITVLDPCCGSGHILVEAFRILVPMRMVEEGLSARVACDAVLRDNLFGLEIDERCTQIAAFNLAFAAWTYPGAGGYRPLPDLHIACSGLAVGGKEEEWLKLAGNDERLREGMRRLYRLFKDAPTLGSLIDPRREEADLFTAGFEELQQLLEQALAREGVRHDAQATEAGIAAQGMAKAAALLAKSYMVVATNVPYLQRNKQEVKLRAFCDARFARSKGDLATVMVERSLRACRVGGTVAVVAPQHALLLKTYSLFRRTLLRDSTLHFVAALGPGAFDTVSGEVVNVALYGLSRSAPDKTSAFMTADANSAKGIMEKAAFLRSGPVAHAFQLPQLKNPDHKILLSGAIEGPLLEKYAGGMAGIQSGDYDRFGRCFWEMPRLLPGWVFQQSTVRETMPFAGREHALLWEDGEGELANSPRAYIRGQAAWGKRGVAVSQMQHLPVTRYTGEAWDNNTAVILPRDPNHLPAIWSFCESPEFAAAVRQIDKTLKVTNATLAKVPFDLAHWQKVAAEKYPNGLPKPFTDDPT
ncbi:MAG: DNA methyltransferase, partial [Bacillota bacterium]